MAAKLAVIGLTIAGIPATVSTFPGRHKAGGHWTGFSHDRLVETLNAEVSFHLAHPDNLPYQLGRVAERCSNLWGIVHANDPVAAMEELEPLAHCRFDGPVLVATSGGLGTLVVRYPGARAAMDALHERCGSAIVPPPANVEIALIEAGLIVNEIMMGGAVEGDVLGVPRLVGFYSLAPGRRRRVEIERGEAFDRLIEEIAQPAEPAAVKVFAQKRITLVGCGALGNWTGLVMVMDGEVLMTLFDGDTAESQNLSRQPILVGHIEEPKATAMAAELASFATGVFEDRPIYVQRPEDLETCFCDALACVPDNDLARLIAAGWAWQRGIPCAVAGTSAAGGQLFVQEPGRACLECLASLALDTVEPPPDPEDDSNSCAQAPDSVVSSNMVLAGLLVSELRQSLSGRRSENLRFHGAGGGANRIGWQISDPPCPHVGQYTPDAVQPTRPAKPR
jgi:molybdopterin/thiamine biosynthesis adenylyltransferase